MQLHQLKPDRPNKNKKPRVGRGGKRGTYSGRGQKGQKARAGHRIRPAERDYIQRLPKLRGYRNKSIQAKPRIINVGDLEKRVAGDVINPKTLPGIDKILGDGDLKKPFRIEKIKVSASARRKIEAVGGSVH
jgi:large subunit ribosomal protein L15